jgi:hypothetical protein
MKDSSSFGWLAKTKLLLMKTMLSPKMQVTGELHDHLTCWDALRAALPVGTVSGAPKVCFSSYCFPFLPNSILLF